MKKSVIVSLCFFLVLLAIIIILCSSPYSLLNNSSKLELEYVYFQNKDITNLIDINRISEILDECELKLSLSAYMPYASDSVLIEIVGIINGNTPFRMYLGDINYCIVHGNRVREVVNPDTILEKIMQYLEADGISVSDIRSVQLEQG